MDTQLMINTCRAEDMSSIRDIVDQKNQKLYFERNKHIDPLQLQSHGLAMLFMALEKNSDLVFGCLRHLNVMHKIYPSIRFQYTQKTIETLDFHDSSIAPTYMDDFFMTIGACVDSPFNGARPEALSFFEYWIQDDAIADTILARLFTVWPWTNRNKYYFLSIIFDRHGFLALLERNTHLCIDVQQFMAGLSISLQYRNLISPGQTLAITLTRQSIPEVFIMIADLLRQNSFQATNCLNHWMRCITNADRVFDLLELSSPDLLDHPRFEYLIENSLHRLICFRSCFKASFAKSSNVQAVDALIVQNLSAWSVSENKVPLLDFIITKTMARPSALNENLPVLERALKANMNDFSSSLRNDVLKMIPNLMYLMAPIIKEDINTPRIRQFFAFVREEIFEYGMQMVHDYQPLIYALRIYEIVVKTLYGSRSDRLIKRFNADVNDRLKGLLIDDNVWPLRSPHIYQLLIKLLQSEFNDVRDISCELLIRFFPQDHVYQQCHDAMSHVDINQCAYAHYLGRIAIHFRLEDAHGLRNSLHQYLQNNLQDYSDPLLKIRFGGGHLYGALNCLNEFYSRVDLIYLPESDRTGHIFGREEIVADIRVASEVVALVLGLFQFGGGDSDRELHGSPSFEKMDESLTKLVERSEYECNAGDENDVGRGREKNKKFLLMSLWTSMKAACDLASSIGVYLLDHPELGGDNYEHLIAECYQLSVRVLVQCRHKGAIEAAGLSLGKLVASITTRFAVKSSMFALLLDSLNSMFGIVSSTDTTRRGAGFSIMVLHLVKSDRIKDKPLLRQVMQKLLAQGTEIQATTVSLHRDNELASVLHFLCVLVKDGDLRLVLTEYFSDIFEITLATIDSKEWVVRNASLQLFGAFVPKLVGQSQFYINDLSWEPVHILYTDIRLKINQLHSNILKLLQQRHQSTIILTTILQLLSRTETIDTEDSADPIFKQLCFQHLNHPNMKVRELAALTLARFHKFYEIPDFIQRSISLVCLVGNPNLRHGLLCAMQHMIAKYKSDHRCMPFEVERVLEEKIKDEFRRHWMGWPANESGRYYLLRMLFGIFRQIGCDRTDDVVLFTMFGNGLVLKEIEENLKSTITSPMEWQKLGFSSWHDSMTDAYVKRKLKDDNHI